MYFEGKKVPLRLGQFILENMEAILQAWEDFARKFWPGPIPSIAALRNDAQRMLRALVEDMGTPQTFEEQRSKSEGAGLGGDSAMNRAALGHALARVNDGFDIGGMVAEFRALRASVNRIWWESVPEPHKEQIEDMVRFNEALDQLVAASVTGFTDRVEGSRKLFLGILGHDLRQPLQSMSMLTAILAEQEESLPAETAPILATMGKCCESMTKMLGDLLDFTTSQLGCEIPVRPEPADIEKICREVLDEMAVAPGRPYDLDASGDLGGEWDAARLRQMISNFLSNARHHGSADHPIHVILRGTEENVTLAVRNMGRPIPPESMNVLFDPLVRGAADERNRPQGSIGLGLYICRQIAAAHGGDIEVESSDAAGTTFTVTLPRRAVPRDDGKR